MTRSCESKLSLRPTLSKLAVRSHVINRSADVVASKKGGRLRL